MMTLCDCAYKAKEKGFIYQDGGYDEEKHEFYMVDKYSMPIYVEYDKGKARCTHLRIKYCPICGKELKLEDLK